MKQVEIDAQSIVDGVEKYGAVYLKPCTLDPNFIAKEVKQSV